MITNKEWINQIHNSHNHATPECCCERCKNGLEAFLIEADIRAIKADAIESVAHDCPPWQSGRFIEVKDVRALAESVRRGE